MLQFRTATIRCPATTTWGVLRILFGGWLLEFAHPTIYRAARFGAAELAYLEELNAKRRDFS